jgi:regulator of protease activity HflC (stomatin/prohibitin superfamily)
MEFNFDRNSNSRSDNQQPTIGLWKLIRIPVYITLALFVLQVIVQPLFMLEVPAGYGAALAVGGSVSDGYYMPGPHGKMPWQHAILMKLRTVAEPRETAPTDSNNQAITARVVPQIWIEPKDIPALARNFGSYESLMKSVVDPQINQATRGQVSLRDPEQLIYERPAVVTGIHKALQDAISEQLQNKGVDPNAVHVGLVAVTQFGFSEGVAHTLELKAESQVKTHTAIANATIKNIVADKDGQVTEITADGEATAAKLLAEANAYKVKKIGEANAAAPDVAKLEAINQWLKDGGHSSRVLIGPGTQVILSGAQAPQAPKQ